MLKQYMTINLPKAGLNIWAEIVFLKWEPRKIASWLWIDSIFVLDQTQKAIFDLETILNTRLSLFLRVW